MIKIIVLGNTGCLGHMVYNYLRKNPGFNVNYTNRRTDKGYCASNHLDAEDFRGNVYLANQFDRTDYVINCVGMIKPHINESDPQNIEKTIKINSVFPHSLYNYMQAVSRQFGNPAPKIIHASTDCVFSGERGNYSNTDIPDATDLYGRSKAMGECPGNMNLRVSIVGPEEYEPRQSLFEWILSHERGSEINGFTNHFWNGITTLQWAKSVEKIIQNDLFESGIHHLSSNYTVDKRQIVCNISDIFDLDLNVNPVEAPEEKNMTLQRTLDLGIESAFVKQILELKEYMNV